MWSYRKASPRILDAWTATGQGDCGRLWRPEALAQPCWNGSELAPALPSDGVVGGVGGIQHCMVSGIPRCFCDLTDPATVSRIVTYAAGGRSATDSATVAAPLRACRCAVRRTTLCDHNPARLCASKESGSSLASGADRAGKECLNLLRALSGRVWISLTRPEECLRGASAIQTEIT